MKHNTVTKHIDKCLKYVEKNSTTILSGIGAVGVVTTAIMAVKATPKAIDILEQREEYKQEIYGEPLTKFERLIAVTPVYLPTILMGSATVAAILGANHINQERQAALTSAYAYLNSSFNEYRNKVNEIFGEDADLKVKDAIAADKYKNIEESQLDMIEKKLFYEEYSGRYFEITIADLQNIIFKINRDYAFTGDMSLNQFYEYFDLPPTELGATIGWSAAKDWECYGYSWIDIQWRKMDMPDNLECYALVFNIDPASDFYEW